MQKYRVRVNYIDCMGKARQIDRVIYGLRNAKDFELRLNFNVSEGITPRLKLCQAAEEFLNVKKNEVRETTVAKHRSILDLYVLPLLGNCSLDRLGVKQVQDWKQYVNEYETTCGKTLSLKYKQNIYSTLCAVLNYAVKMEYIRSNPLARLGNFRDSSIINKEANFYTAGEFKRFIAAGRHFAEEAEEDGDMYEWNFYIFFMLAFYTGMRRGEISALRWTDIKNNTIHVTRSVVQKLRGEDRETPPKNKSSVRAIRIPLPLLTALDEHYLRCKNKDGRICGGERCIRDSTVDFKNRKYSEAAKIKTIRIHDFRHSHASVLINAGINIQEIARRLGHSRVEQTWKTYSHLYPREEERALKELNKIV